MSWLNRLFMTFTVDLLRTRLEPCLYAGSQEVNASAAWEAMNNVLKHHI